MNWYVCVTVFFIVSLHQVFAKIPTDSTSASTSIVAEAAVIQPLLQVKPPKSFDFTEHEDWPRWLKRFDLRHIQR